MNTTCHVAVLADIHSNHFALEACVTYALEKGIHDFIFLGDYISDLPYPQKTFDFLYDLNKKYACTFIKGNREDYFINYRKEKGNYWGKGSSTGSLWYTYNNLREHDFIFIESLVNCKTIHYDGLPDICICHGSPRKINELIYENTNNIHEIIENVNEKYIICGHTHKRMHIVYNDINIINPGSVGVPLDSPMQTQFALLKGCDNKWDVEMITIPYDVDACFKEFTESGLAQIAPYWVETIKRIIVTGMDNTPKIIDYIKNKTSDLYDWKDVPEKYWVEAIEKIWNNE